MNRRNSSNSLSNGTIIGGLLIGTAIGAATAYLMSNKGKDMREKLANTCCDLSKQARDIAEEVAEKSSSITDDLSDLLLGTSKRRSNDDLIWIIGGIGAAVLGVSALAFLSTDSSKDMRGSLLDTFQTITEKTSRLAGDIQDSVHDVAENLDDRVTCWVTIAQRFLDSVNGYAKAAASSKGRSCSGDSTLDKAADWAAFGIKLYQSLKK